MEDEILDLVNEDDEVIRTINRSEVGYGDNLREGRTRVVNILIFNSKGKLLLPKRSMDRRLFPGCYDFSCAEHVQAGETYLDAAIRGLKEELGIRDIQLKELGKIKRSSRFLMIYFLIFDGEILEYDKEGIDEFLWLDLKTIKKIIKKDKAIFKYDFPIVIDWYEKNF